VFRIDRLALTGRLARLHIEGTVTLQQRLDLDVVAATNTLGVDPALQRLLSIRLPSVGPVPLGLVTEVSNYLSNRTIRLSVGGTIRAPVVRVNTAATLSEAAVRFFLGQAIP
jgi:hypothetical protein